jgi:acyl-coenzyme A synthetase/AMP-(fatty) acid ligase
MKIPPMKSYEQAAAEFRWDLPATFNFGRDVVDAHAAAADGLALVAMRDGAAPRRYRFSDISRASSQLAHLLHRGGLRAGDRVIVQLPRIPAWHVAMAACTKLGAVAIPCVDMLTAKDIEYRAQHAGAAGAITTAANTAKYARCDMLRLRLCTGTPHPELPPGWLSLDEEAARESQAFHCFDTPIEAPAILYYTSGSTGHPKGVSHAARALFAWRLSAAYWQQLGPEDLNWCTADTGWAKSGTGVLFAPWSMGAGVVLYDGGFDPLRRLELMAQLGVTVFCASATEFRHMVQADTSAYNLSRLRLCVSAGESVNPEVVRRWREQTSVQLLDGYGQTETLMTILNYPCAPVKPGSMGRPIPGAEFAVIDAEGRLAGAGEPGQIAMRLPHPQFMLGYLHDETKTRENIATLAGQDYWMTGDLGWRDEDGYYFYSGRADDIISSAGYRIGPMEVENALITHPAVLESAVVGKPDAERGEIVKAFVVLRAGVTPSLELVCELQRHVKNVTAPYKYPREIEFRDSLPKNAAGKVLRRVLRDEGGR